ncbi:MAG: hypothetical protein Q8O03_07560 [Nanoarchaeota archaeon]|nr:hypothetical protein [Nanoarchaeota archaeon]
MKKRVALNKLAISPIIATVLLLGFAIALGTSVFLWQVRQTEELSKGVVDFVDAGMGCESVYLNVHAEDGCSSITVVNRGMFDLNGLVVRSFGQFGAKSVTDEIVIDVKKDASLSLGMVNADKIEVVPLLKSSGGLVGCKDRTVSVSCEGLTELQKFTCEQADPNNCDRLSGTGIVTCEKCCTSLSKCCSC